MPNIYLRSVPSDANINDVRLYDPTVPSGKVDYVLTCAAGAYVYTGVAASLKVAHTLSCAAGAYSYTGGGAGFKVSRSLVCAPGAYTYSGIASSLKVARSLQCLAGSYSLSGNTATLTYSPGAAGKVDYALTCDTGAYSVSGNPAQMSYAGASTVAVGIGHGRPRRVRPIAIVEYDGRDYRVPLDSMDSFLEAIKKKAENPAPVKVVTKKKKKTLKVSPDQPPKIVIKSAPPDFMAEFKQFVDRSNEILDKIWQGMISRALSELDDEEALLMALL